MSVLGFLLVFSPTKVFVITASDNYPHDSDGLKAKIDDAFPKAIEELVDYFQNDEVLSKLPQIEVKIQDSNSSFPDWTSSFSVPYELGQSQVIQLFGPSFETGRSDLEQTLRNDLVSMTVKKRQGYQNWNRMPEYVRLGLPFLRHGFYRDYLALYINAPEPIFDADKILEDPEMGKHVRAALFGRCFEKLFGKGATYGLIRSLYKGDPWERAVSKALQAYMPYGVLEKKIEICIHDTLEDILKQGGSYEKEYKAIQEKNFEKAAALAKTLLEDHPESIWLIRCTYDMAQAQMELGNYDAAIASYEKVRTGEMGDNLLYDKAALGIAEALVKKGECKDASEKYQEFFTLYPRFRNEWANPWNELYKQACQEKQDQ